MSEVEKKETEETEETKKPEEPKEPQKPPTDFKIAEIWVRSGQIMLDAPQNFWTEKARALGVLELCKDIVKTAQPPKQPKSKIVKPSGFRNFVRGLKRR